METAPDETLPTVLIVADDPLARGGIALTLRAFDDRVHVDTTRFDALDLAPRADLLLVDLGHEAARVAEHLDTVSAMEGIVFVALAADESAAHDALAAGARGVLARESTGRTLIAALLAVIEGLHVVDPAVTPRATSPRPRTARSTEDLTAREHEVLQLLAAGLANKTIAQRLGISDHTVKFHVNAILAKLGAQSRTEAVVNAARTGLVIL